jgi:hypothetical protein
MIEIGFTYEVITPESAEQGDVAERGGYEPGGWKFADEYEPKPWHPGTLRDAIKSARNLGISEPSQWPAFISAHGWFSSADPDPDYRTGENTYYSLHVSGVTVATLNRIRRILQGRKIFERC